MVSDEDNLVLVAQAFCGSNKGKSGLNLFSAIMLYWPSNMGKLSTKRALDGDYSIENW